VTRLEAVIEALREFYGALPVPPRDPFGCFVWEMLSVHSTPWKRDAAFGALKRIPALTPDAMARAPEKKLEDSVALAGPYLEQRLHALKTGIDRFRRSPTLPVAIRGSLRGARRALAGLPQMNDGGAHRMLLFGGGHALFPLNQPVSRVALRLGYGDSRDPDAEGGRSMRKTLAGELHGDVDALCRAVVYLSHHGAATCTDSTPHCTICPLLRGCAYGTRTMASG
jgi:endonuclease III